MGEIYKLTFPNGKVYIGLSKITAADRFKRHKLSVKDSKHLLYRAWRKYGEPVMSVIHQCDNKDLNALERHYIALLGAKYPLGYNLTSGGEGMLNYAHTAEAKAKIAEAGRGRIWTEERRKAFSERQKGVPKQWTPEWKAAIKASVAGKGFNKGVKRTNETKDKQAVAKKTWWNRITEEQRSAFIANRVAKQAIRKAEKEANGTYRPPGTNWWAALTPEQKAEFCARRAQRQAEIRRTKLREAAK